VKSDPDKGIKVMSFKDRRSLISGSITLFVVLSFIFLNLSTSLSQEAKAPDFQAVTSMEKIYLLAILREKLSFFISLTSKIPYVESARML
jgi:hypothetical protein